MRLLVIGNIPVDLVMRVPRLPGSGDDVEAQTLDVVVGGSFHVIRAAAAAGLAARFAGTHGTGGYGDLVRSALSEIGADVVQSPLPDRDTGVVVTLVEPGGERSFVTGPYAVIPFSAETLDRIPVADDDLVYVSGYSLGSADSRPLARWLGAIPRRTRVFCDLGPRGVVGDGEVLDLVLRRADWLACNQVEAAAFTDERDPAACARSLAARTAHATALVRAGATGC
jgi:sugar/nucleoside kinase (ribokinase family)